MVREFIGIVKLKIQEIETVKSVDFVFGISSLRGCFLFRKFQKCYYIRHWKFPAIPVKQLIRFLSDLRSLFLIYLTNKEALAVPL